MKARKKLRYQPPRQRMLRHDGRLTEYAINCLTAGFMRQMLGTWQPFQAITLDFENAREHFLIAMRDGMTVGLRSFPQLQRIRRWQAHAEALMFGRDHAKLGGREDRRRLREHLDYWDTSQDVEQTVTPLPPDFPKRVPIEQLCPE